MTFEVQWSDDALADLAELHDWLALRDADAAERAIETIQKGAEALERFPASFRVAGRRGGDVVRELVVPFGRRGYVLLFSVEDERHVMIVAVRHQREGDYR